MALRPQPIGQQQCQRGQKPYTFFAGQPEPSADQPHGEQWTPLRTQLRGWQGLCRCKHPAAQAQGQQQQGLRDIDALAHHTTSRLLQPCCWLEGHHGKQHQCKWPGTQHLPSGMCKKSRRCQIQGVLRELQRQSGCVIEQQEKGIADPFGVREFVVIAQPVAHSDFSRKTHKQQIIMRGPAHGQYWKGHAQPEGQCTHECDPSPIRKRRAHPGCLADSKGRGMKAFND
ncbi:hypothetical protein D3C72_1493600 [compost metagenome]